MKKKTLLAITLCLLAQISFAQAPKWVDKAKRAVFSVVTYDKNDQILNTGNGFFVTEEGVALSDYTLFKGAQRAVVMTADGLQLPVEAIMGADDMYDVVKFRVTVDGKKKVAALPIVTTAPTVGASAYLLPYSTRKDRSFTSGKVSGVDKVSGQYYYYTLDMRLKEKMVSCPLMTADGQVFGLAQKASGQDTATICYAIDAAFAMSREINALSYNDRSLQAIGIKKALPDTEEQALVFLYMVSTQLPAEKYMAALNDFITQYPNSADGYMRRASQQLFMSTDAASMEKVVADMDQALERAANKDDVYYNRAKTIYNYMLNRPEQAYEAWSYDKALEEVRQAIALNPLPIYMQLEGDIHFAKQDYAAALASFEQVNKSNLASPTSFFSAAKSKQLLEAPAEEVLALIDSCLVRFPQPYMTEAAPYLFERAQAQMAAGKARQAMLDYDAYFNAMNGQVNDLFYYYREQAALKARQYQRALDDMAKAIELNPNDLTYRAELAVINIRVGRNETALEVLNDALKIAPNYAEAYRLMGITYIQMKKQKEACANFEKAKALGDPHVDALIEKHCK